MRSEERNLSFDGYRTNCFMSWDANQRHVLSSRTKVLILFIPLLLFILYSSVSDLINYTSDQHG